MTIGSFSVRAVGPHGQQLANVAAISTGPAAALELVKNSMQTWPAGTRFHVRGGAPRQHNGLPFLAYWHDEASDISPDQWDALRSWGRIERLDEDPDEALAEFRGDSRFALIAIVFGGGIAALQALRWWLS